MLLGEVDHQLEVKHIIMPFVENMGRINIIDAARSSGLAFWAGFSAKGYRGHLISEADKARNAEIIRKT
ncbi:MAG: hypothetical protein COA81_03645 [Alphaproteobacteria bacterium]|nr:MAG: hypothetical protein COA81_03645 [Alphaproteobacteria bacterium]